MVDFTNLRKKKEKNLYTDPREIFFSIPKSGLNDLWTSQSEVLDEWYKNRIVKNTIIKLHTGGGKTLVGLIIAKSIMNETNGPVLYLVPTIQLMEQVYEKSLQYGIEADKFDDAYDLSNGFQKKDSILIATYARLFNGRSKFGILGESRKITKVQGIIADDAHTASSSIRSQFTIEIGNKEELYKELRGTFRSDFADLGKVGTFDALESGNESAILEVPYWAIKIKIGQVRSSIQRAYERARDDIPESRQDRLFFVWPLLRDNLSNCHILFSNRGVTITPIGIDIMNFPTFTDSPKRIFMSATLRDHADIVKTFGLRVDNKSLKVIAPKTVTGIGEKMILMPELMPNFLKQDSLNLTKNLISKIGIPLKQVVVIVPSKRTADRRWSKFGTIVTSDDVQIELEKRVRGNATLPSVFVNRYDGMDLKGDSCRILVLDELPSEIGDYDRYLSTMTSGGETRSAIIASRIEQGIGRSSRGSGDYSLIFLIGKSLTSWINVEKNRELLTISTKTQLEIGREISDNLKSEEELVETGRKCLERKKDWIEFHNSALIEAIQDAQQEEIEWPILQADLERKFHELIRDGEYSKAFSSIKDDPPWRANLDNYALGWLKQLAARAAYFGNELEQAKILQTEAYKLNRGLMRPASLDSYWGLVPPLSQCKSLFEKMAELHTASGIISDFDSFSSNLNMSSQTANQFEEAIKKLGQFLGFAAERPDHDFHKGPDVLWISQEKIGFVIEVKNDKDVQTPFNKKDNGQMLDSIEWFKQNYPGFKHIPLVIGHNNIVTANSSVSPSLRFITPKELDSIVSALREVLTKMVRYYSSGDKTACDGLIQKFHLDYAGFIDYFTRTPNVFHASSLSTIS